MFPKNIDTYSCVVIFTTFIILHAADGESNGDVRIIQGDLPNEGRLEVFYGGSWGTVCNADWGLRDTDVVCRMLGYDRGVLPPDFIEYGGGEGLIMLQSVECKGYEQKLNDCVHSRWLKHNCGHHQDIGIRCINSEGA